MTAFGNRGCLLPTRFRRWPQPRANESRSSGADARRDLQRRSSEEGLLSQTGIDQ